MSYRYLYGPDLRKYQHKYSIVLTGLAIFHRYYLWEYARLPKKILDIVDRERSCEDILLNFLVYRYGLTDKTHATHWAIVNVQCRFLDPLHTEFRGLSGLTHRNVRSKCLGEFIEYFGNILYGHRPTKYVPGVPWWYPRENPMLYNETLTVANNPYSNPRLPAKHRAIV